MVLQTLTLFQTKMCNLSVSLSDCPLKFIPIFRPSPGCSKSGADNSIQWINRYPADKLCTPTNFIRWIATYPLDTEYIMSSSLDNHALISRLHTRFHTFKPKWLQSIRHTYIADIGEYPPTSPSLIA